MKYRTILAVFLVSMLFFLLFLRINLVKDPSRPDFFVGVDSAYDDVEDTKRLVDEVRSCMHAMDSRVAYVLPEDYGYGFRGPDDKTWGLWEDDPLSDQIWKGANTLSEDYALQLDIIYEDGVIHNSTSRYSKFVFWN